MVVNGKHTLHQVVIDEKEEKFLLPSADLPDYMVFDAPKVLLAKVREKKTKTEWVEQLKNAQNYVQKSEALSELAFDAENLPVANVLLEATEDPYWGVRKNALANLGLHSGSLLPRILDRAEVLAVEDPKSDVRRTAVTLLGEYGIMREMESSDPVRRMAAEKRYDSMKAVMMKAVNDSSYSVASGALRFLAKWDTDLALDKAKTMEAGTNETLISTIAGLYMDAKDPGALDFVADNIFKMGGGLSKFTLITEFSTFVNDLEGEDKTKGINLMKEIAEKEATWWIRLSAARALFTFIKEPGMREFIQQRMEAETNETIKNMYEKSLAE